MQAALIRVFLPHAEVLLHVDALDAVERDHVELTHRFVVLGRVARRDNDPASGSFWLPKVLHCKNCSIIGVSRLEMQLISSKNRMPSRTPVRSMRS